MSEITVRIIAYGVTKELLGNQKINLVLPVGTIAALRQELNNKNTKFDQLTSLRFAVHDEFVNNDYQLLDQDEVILIPPVSGG